MRQEVCRLSRNRPPTAESWLGRLKGLFDYSRALLAAEANQALLHEDKIKMKMNRPTRKEALMSVDPKHVDPKQQLRVHIRWMIRRDMREVLDVEQQSFEFPWYEEDFIRCLRQRNCIGMVAEHGERVVGFMIYELHKTRLHILNFAVAENMRHRGVGCQMAQKLIGKLSNQRRTRISLEVRETNLSAQMFFKEVGFRATSVLRSYYEDSPEDAYVMQFRYEPEEAADILPLNRIDRMAG
jgi:ribosomal-protein-alanine N-acetyltransferase